MLNSLLSWGLLTRLNKERLITATRISCFDFLWIWYFPSKISNCYYKNTLMEIYFQQIIICWMWILHIVFLSWPPRLISRYWTQITIPSRQSQSNCWAVSQLNLSYKMSISCFFSPRNCPHVTPKRFCHGGQESLRGEGAAHEFWPSRVLIPALPGAAAEPQQKVWCLQGYGRTEWVKGGATLPCLAWNLTQSSYSKHVSLSSLDLSYLTPGLPVSRCDIWLILLFDRRFVQCCLVPAYLSAAGSHTCHISVYSVPDTCSGAGFVFPISLKVTFDGCEV